MHRLSMKKKPRFCAECPIWKRHGIYSAQSRSMASLPIHTPDLMGEALYLLRLNGTLYCR